MTAALDAAERYLHSQVNHQCHHSLPCDCRIEAAAVIRAYLDALDDEGCCSGCHCGCGLNYAALEAIRP